MRRRPQHGLALDSKLPATEGASLDSSGLHATEQAFRLAFFIHPDREIALATTVRALASLEDQVEEQRKRNYFNPRGSRTKVSRNKAQLLQHLILVVACSWPKARHIQELNRETQQEQLLIRFLSQLVRISCRRNSFYVCLAISRILYDYSTRESIAIHDFVAQDPERARGDAYFRYGKGLLLKELQRYLEPYIATERQRRGELRISAHEEPTRRQIELVDECLRLLTPWQTECPLPAALKPLLQEVPRLRFTGSDANEEHPFELRRMHALLHPACYAKLSRALGFGSPQQRLRIPRFRLSPATPSSGSQADTATFVDRRAARLTARERQWIDDELRSILRRRRHWLGRRLDS